MAGSTDRKPRGSDAADDRFRSLFEQLPFCVCIHDRDMNILDVNQRMCDVYGYTRDEFQRLSIWDIDGVVDRDFTAAIMAEIDPSGARVFEYAHKRKSGEVFPVEIRSTEITLDGQPVVVSSSYDITGRKRTEDALGRADKLESLGVLAGGLAHDFNNLLGGVFAHLELAVSECADNPRATEYLDSAISAHGRAKDLTQQLLTFAKGGAPDKRVISVVPLLSETQQFALSGSKVACRVTTVDTPLDIEADASQLAQVFNNILLNSREAMPAGGKIEIECGNRRLGAGEVDRLVEGDYVQVAIRDEGEGIPPSDLPRLFDPFFTTKMSRSGLGLSMAYSIAAKHGGGMYVESEPGAGTAVVVLLPATAKPRTELPEPRRHTARAGAVVLAVDDEALVLRATLRMLARLGYEGVGARSGREAIELYAKALEDGARFDLVILDLTMPGGMGGVETLDALAELDPSVTAVVASGYADDPVLSEPEKFGFAGKLAKPYLLADLESLLGAIFDSESAE